MGEFREDVGVAAALDDGVNWEATSHQQIYDWFVQGPPESLRASVEAWSDKIAAHVEAASDAVTQALQTSGVHWEGQAAEAMRSSTGPLAEHALRNQVAAMLAGGATSLRVTEASDLAAAIPEPQPARTQQELFDANGGDLFNYLEDVQAQEAAAQEAESRARELAASYDASTDFAVSALPQFNPMVSVTTGVATPSQPGPVVSEYGDPGTGGENGGPGTGPGADGGRSAGPASVAPPAATDTPGGTSSQSWTPPQSGAQPPPTAPASPPVQDGGRPPGPMPGLVADPRGRSTSGGPGGRPPGGAGPGGRAGGQGGSAGGQPGARGGGAAGPGVGVRGGPGVVEGPAARGGASAVPGRASGGAGMMPMGAGAGRGQGDEDTERTSPEYLRDHHDEFWDDTPPVAPPVIGEDDDE